MDTTRLTLARIADTAGSWIAITIAAVVLLDDLLFGLESATEPRVIEAAIGICAAIGIGLTLSPFIGNYPRFIPLARIAVVASSSAISVIGKLSILPFSISIRFVMLVVASLLAWFDAAGTRACEVDKAGNTMVPRVNIAIICVALLTGGSLWQQRENLYSWSPAVEATMNAVAAIIAVAAFLILFIIEKASSHASETRAFETIEVETARPLGTAIMLALCAGATCGVYLSLSMLIAQNTAFEYPDRVVYGINAMISLAIVAGIIVAQRFTMNKESRLDPRNVVDSPAGLVLLLSTVIASVGLPWLFGTLDIVDFTTAGSLHVSALITVPMLGYFMLSRLARIKKTGGYCAVIVGFGGFGLVIGIAGYLAGGNTYNMDFYVGMVYTLLLALGVITAWLFKPGARTRHDKARDGLSPVQFTSLEVEA